MSKRRLYLHVGVHRTGTSSIQHALKSDFGQLLWRGVFHAYATARHKALFDDLFSGKQSARAIAQDITNRADAKPCHIHSVTLSDEDICMRRDLSPLAGLSEYFEVHPVLFVRRQDCWLESWYRQHVKWQWDKRYAHLRFEDFLARRQDFFWVDYERLARGLAHLFGKNSLIIIPFEEGRFAANSVSLFYDALGVGDLPDAVHETKNQSFSMRMTEFMRGLPLAKLPIEQRHRIERACAKVDAGIKDRSSFFANATQRGTILAEYSASNTRLAQSYFGRDSLFRSDQTRPILAACVGQSGDTTEALIKDIIAPLIMTLSADVLPAKHPSKPRQTAAEQAV